MAEGYISCLSLGHQTIFVRATAHGAEQNVDEAMGDGGPVDHARSPKLSYLKSP